MKKKNIVSLQIMNDIYYTDKQYLFRPDTAYPEYLFPKMISPKQNSVYELVRKGFQSMGMDEDHFNTPDWNPLSEIISPGNTVLIKPNLVMDINPVGTIDCMFTQPDVVAAVIDYVLIALKGTGKIIVGDAPVQECNFNNLIQESGYDKLIEWYQSLGNDIELIDFRGLVSQRIGGINYAKINENADGKVIDLKQDSEFSNLKEEQISRLRITNYDPHELLKHHSIEKHEYNITNSVLQADAVINIPKPKTHCKAGVTISLKNMIGLNVRKEYLPHHTIGAIKEEGDEYRERNVFKRIGTAICDCSNTMISKKRYNLARTFKIVSRIFNMTGKIISDTYMVGSWSGNSTISKTICDVNKILIYADKNGIMQNSPQRKIFIVADMIVSGEGEGPLFPTAKSIGMIAMGKSPVIFDEVVATIMGADVMKIPTLVLARKIEKYKLIDDEEAFIVSNRVTWNQKSIGDILKQNDIIQFTPASGWKSVFSEGCSNGYKKNN